MPEEQGKKGAGAVQKSAQTAHAVHGAIKTGKAIAGAAKGAAVGGPYGAAAAALWENRRTVIKIVIAVGVLLFLPVLFVLMLPSMIFGGLDATTGDVPILNNNAAILENIAEADAIVRTTLSDSRGDVLIKIQEDIETLDEGVEHRIVDPYEGQLLYSTSLIISQYCVAEGGRSSIDLADFRHVVEQAREHLFSYSKELQVETVVQNGEVVSQTTTAVYTLQYAGEAYFGDTLFALSEEQAAYAKEYAENLELFLSDPLLSVTYETGENEYVRKP